MAIRVQNIELQLLLKNCHKYKWFIQFRFTGLNIVNLIKGI